MKRTAGEYAILLQLLDQALDLPEQERESWIEQLSGKSSELQPTLRRLLLQTHSNTRCDDISKQIGSFAREAVAYRGASEWVAGKQIGAYRLIRELGRGGMGSVWLAERFDGAFNRTVALKLPHLTFRSGLADRMMLERHILSGLEHPGIARLYDGGITDDGRPYMAMEFVEGESLTTYCDARMSSLGDRLALFLLICEAVSYAHAHLVVHRDLKPANIFVTAAGQVKLLDFGIAKMLEPNVVSDSSRTAHLSPAYAAPEQLMGSSVTTATDVYALGVVLFQLLSGRLPWAVSELPLAAAVRLLDDEPPRLSVSVVDSWPVDAKDLRGDVDAIVAKALRKDPAVRYPDARTLAQDIGRHLRFEPVQARSGARTYVLRRFLRRRWLPLSAAAAVLVALSIGISVALWQARRAESAASRATATKDFLVSLFRASDPRVAQDKPRTDLTAKQLLDLGSERIEKEFASQPELQIELLGLTAEIYDFMNVEERYASIQRRRVELARIHYGPAHPIVIRGLLDDADAACVRQDYAKATQILDETDVLLRSSHQDRSFLRALWWRTRARVLLDVPDGQGKRLDAFNQSLALFKLYGANTTEYAAALDMAAIDATHRGELLEAKVLNEQALAVAERAPQRDDANIAIMMSNLARKEERLGFFEAAQVFYDRAEDQELKTFGDRNMIYWFTRAHHGLLLCFRGQRDLADRIFGPMIESMPKDWKRDDLVSTVSRIYAECLTIEGRAREALPLFEEAYRAYLDRGTDLFSLRDVRQELGDAYDRVGRVQDARDLLRAVRDDVIANEGPGSTITLSGRERWGRFLLDHSKPGQPEFDAAETELKSVATQAGPPPWIAPAQAHADLARIAIARGDAAQALAQSRQALTALDRVQGLYDIRTQPRLWLVYSSALLLSGDAASARIWAEKALEASRRYDVGSADSIRAAEAAIRAAIAGSNGSATKVTKQQSSG